MANEQLKTVVIADDDKNIRESLKKFFQGTMYHVVAEASNGLDVVENCKKYTPDIAIVDIQMPIMNGLQASEAIVVEKSAKCVIMLTSFDDKEYVDQAIQVGAMGYLTKPVELGVVIPTMEVCLAKSKEYYLLNKDVKKLKRRSNTRDIIDKAKLVIMERKDVSEDKAYEIIRELSSRKQISMDRIAQYLLGDQGHEYE
ncbi:MAG: ANTAR domain-containing response regulator [Aminipila sp.]